MADQNWDTSKPIDHTKVSVLPAEIRGLRSSAKSIIQKEHVALGSNNSGGQHLKGATRVYLDSDLPTTDPESNNLDTSATSDDGRIAVVTSDNTLKVYIATAVGISTGWEDVRVADADTAAHVKAVNNTWLVSKKAGQPATTIEMIKVNGSDVVVLSSPTGYPASLSVATTPAADKDIATKKYVDDHDLSAEQDSSSSSLSTTSTTYATILTDDITLPAKRTSIMAWASCGVKVESGTGGYFRLRIDGTVVCEQHVSDTGGGKYHAVSLNGAKGTLTGGSTYTVEVQWKRDSTGSSELTIHDTVNGKINLVMLST